MKRMIPLLLVTCLGAALAGWGAARLRAASRERQAVAQVQLAREAARKKLAMDLAELVKQADEVVISYSYPSEKGKPEIRFSDPTWLSRLSSIVEAASCEPTGHGLWISSPRVTFYRHKAQVAEFTMLHATLRADSPSVAGDFIVGRGAIQAITDLVAEKPVAVPAITSP